jgi:hypothetical protein
MSALTVVQNVCGKLGITAPNAVFSSTDPQIIQIRTIMNDEGRDLSRAHTWTALLKQQTFTSVAQAVQTGAVPTDFNWYMNDTMWNRGTQVKVGGPVSPEDWQAFQAIALLAIPNAVFRFRGGDILIYPTPAAGQTIAYEYGSTYWVQGSKTEYTADADVAVLDETIIALGTRWRFLKSKGMDYAEDFRSYEIAKQQAVSRDGGRQKVYLGGYPRNPWNFNIPQSNWPS